MLQEFNIIINFILTTCLFIKTFIKTTLQIALIFIIRCVDTI